MAIRYGKGLIGGAVVVALLALLIHWIGINTIELYRDDLLFYLQAHLILVLASMLAALVVGIPAGIFLSRPTMVGRAERFMQVFNIGNTVPPLAVLAIALGILGIGSGVVLSARGDAVTCGHLVNGVYRLVAEMYDGTKREVTIYSFDADADIAHIRVVGSTLPYLGVTTEVEEGDTVYALGNPLGLGLAMSRGIVSATAHEADLSTLTCIVSDATISRGSSGGALLNEYGRAVAVTTGAYVYGNNMYLCVPLDPVLEADLTGEGMTLQEVLDAVTAAREAAAAAAGTEAAAPAAA